MSEPRNDNSLGQQRTVVVVLRLVIGPQGDLSHGEIVNPAGQVGARFSTWNALLPTLQTWLQKNYQ